MADPRMPATGGKSLNMPAAGGAAAYRGALEWRQLRATLARMFKNPHAPVVLHTCGDDAEAAQRQLRQVVERNDLQEAPQIDARWPRGGPTKQMAGWVRPWASEGMR